MDFNFGFRIGSLSPDYRLHFYELLAHNLTVSIRGIWSEPDLSDGEKLDRIYHTNEILHRITAKIYTLRLNLHEWTEEDIGKMIQDSIGQNEAIEKDVMAAINFSYKAVVGKTQTTSYDREDA
jgi:hypothetical protein